MPRLYSPTDAAPGAADAPGAREVKGSVEGQAALERVLAALPADTKAALEPVVLGARWYPIGVQAALHEAVHAFDAPARAGVCGRLHGLLELCGGREVLVRVEHQDATSWKLHATWQ
jgi:hypothetical protein